MNCLLKTGFAALLCCLCSVSFLAAEDAYEVKTLDALPHGLAEDVAKTLSPNGVEVAGENGPVCRVWLGKSLAAKKGFTPNFNVKYPFTNGQLVGVIEVVQKEEYTDFRGQPVEPGIYTLRYGLQPQDGNHLGTSIVRDFLLALPAKSDKSAKPVTDNDTLLEQSSEVAQSTHPAIFALQGIKESPGKPTLEHDEDKEFWILKTSAGVDGEGKSIPIQLVVVGHAEG